MLPPQPIDSERMAARELLPLRRILKSLPIIVSESTAEGAEKSVSVSVLLTAS